MLFPYAALPPAAIADGIALLVQAKINVPVVKSDFKVPSGESNYQVTAKLTLPLDAKPR